MSECRVYRLSTIPEDRPIERLRRRRVIGEQAMLSDVHLDKGCDVQMHAHPNEQFAFVMTGRLRFAIGDPNGNGSREIVVEAGEVLHLPSNVPHAAFALEDSHVLDVFSPPSERTGIDRR